ncbi:MAG: NADH:ubiquinone reductase (Na(+)-transporting) subunit C [Prevotellaceae bacterium]|jgi:Na+-transporting NADH:ubiquinone oxidoreductase subunit C|nr:NADH:ubiquinone reductase (Na(+)-transporting) subunit C [Prevotellaceae bacterium]
MNKESNKYIFLYSIILVVTVAAVLAAAATLLKPFQQKNVEVEKKQNILFSVQKAAQVKEAKDKTEYIEREYKKYITSSYVVNSFGMQVEGDAFTLNFADEMKKPSSERLLPVFVCKDDDGSLLYVLPVRGVGLWGPLWGYVALNQDVNIIRGVVFDHKGETPGLGAEIATPQFQAQFAGKQIFDGETFTSIKVVKGGNTKNNPHEVDAVSGGTITSNGLQDMVYDVLESYMSFLKAKRQEYAARVCSKNSAMENAKTASAAPSAKVEVRPVVKPKPAQVQEVNLTPTPAPADTTDSIQ